MATLFTKIIQGQIPGTIVYQDDLCAAIQDIQPQAPQHILLVPKKEIPSITEATKEDQAILGHLLLTAAEIAKRSGVDQSGYRLVINAGEDAGQTVSHLHIHILGGRPMKWPPG
jgi:histidine triad (HIT) family protein